MAGVSVNIMATIGTVLLSLLAYDAVYDHWEYMVEKVNVALSYCSPEAVAEYATWVLGFVIDFTSEFIRNKRHFWHHIRTLGGYLPMPGGENALYGVVWSPECVDPTWRDYVALASLSLSAIIAVLLSIHALKFFYTCIHRKVVSMWDWAWVKKAGCYAIVFTTSGTLSYISPESAMMVWMLLGFISARRSMSLYNPHPIPTLRNTMPDTGGIFITDSLPRPPPRNVGGLEMAIEGVKTNKITFDKAPFAFLICSDNWEFVIGMGFRVEIDGYDVLVTVLHVHSGWEKKRAEDGYMYIFGKNGRARFRPKVVFASKALDLVYYEYPKEISAAGVAKGKYLANKCEGMPIWVLTPPTENDGMIESSCARTQCYAPYHIMHWANTRPGSSGSPIYTKDGIIGVHRGSDGVRSNFGILLFSKPKFPMLETASPHLAHAKYVDDDFGAQDERALTRKQALADAHADLLRRAQGYTWADDVEEDPDGWGYGESAYAPPGMNPLKKGPWVLDVMYHGEYLTYPVGFNGLRSIGRPFDGKENEVPAQKSSPVSGTTAGSSKTEQSSSPPSAMTTAAEPVSGNQELEKPILGSLESALTRALEKMQAQMVQELRALKEPQPLAQSSGDGVSQIEVPQQSTPPSSTKPTISKRAEKRARKNAAKSSNGSKSATPATKPSSVSIHI